ncbi:hypothetical protein HYR53_10405 [Candidatus Acetothermia bacterium]|nr:hypothetical protein [Candidatus Acetothermia bacterium]
MRMRILMTMALIVLSASFLFFGQTTQPSGAACSLQVTWIGLQTQNIPDRGFRRDDWLWSIGVTQDPVALQFANFKWDANTSASAMFGPVDIAYIPTATNSWKPKSAPILLDTTFTDSTTLRFTTRITEIVQPESNFVASVVNTDHEDKRVVNCASGATSIFGFTVHDDYVGKSQFDYRIDIAPVQKKSAWHEPCHC